MDNSEIDLTCPACGASVGYDDTEVVDDPDMCGCPVCGEASPTDDWFG